MKSYLQIAALALMVSIAGRLAGQAWDSSRNEKLTGDLCGVVGNYLEVGSLREAFEGMSQGLPKSPGWSCWLQRLRFRAAEFFFVSNGLVGGRKKLPE
jgi:hypothetical protein